MLNLKIRETNLTFLEKNVIAVPSFDTKRQRAEIVARKVNSFSIQIVRLESKFNWLFRKQSVMQSHKRVKGRKSATFLPKK